MGNANGGYFRWGFPESWLMIFYYATQRTKDHPVWESPVTLTAPRCSKAPVLSSKPRESKHKLNQIATTTSTTSTTPKLTRNPSEPHFFGKFGMFKDDFGSGFSSWTFRILKRHGRCIWKRWQSRLGKVS